MTWDTIRLNPDEMIEPMAILSYDFLNGSIAGSVGKKVNSQKKPGIQEDGGIAAISESLQIFLLIDGHYHRDTTEIMIEVLESEISSDKWNLSTVTDGSNILNTCLEYSDHVIKTLQERSAKGEASYMMVIKYTKLGILFYFQVGDLMMFVDNPTRAWQSSFQVSSRHFYEWINSRTLMGYNFGKLVVSPGSRVIIATDGLKDQPYFQFDEISNLFEIEPFTARNLVQYALDHTPIYEDDNISVIVLEF